MGRLGAHVPERGAGAIEHPGQVHGERALPGRIVNLVDRNGRAASASIVEQCIDPARPFRKFGKGGVNRTAVRDVRSKRHRFVPAVA